MNKFTKRLLSLAVVVVMLMAMMPAVFAEEPTYTDWDGDSAALVDGAYLKLTDNLEVTSRYVVNGKTVTIDLNGFKITSAEAVQLLYITSGAKVTLKNGTIEMPGLATESGSAMGGIIQTSSTAAELNLENMTVTRTAATTNLNHGGILYARVPVTIKDSVLQVSAPVDMEAATIQEGGLIKISSGCTLTIEDSTLFGTRAKYGGCVFATGSSEVAIKTSTLTGGIATSRGGDLYTGGNASAAIYSGSQVDAFYHNGKTFTIDNGVKTGTNPARYAVNSEAVVKWGENEYSTREFLIEGIQLASIDATVIMCKDVTLNYEIYINDTTTLDLNGHTLTVDAVNATKGNIANSKDTGKLITDSVSFKADNKQLPMKNGNEYVFETVAFAEQLDAAAGTYKFYIKNEAATTLIDDAIAAGEDVTIDIYVTWTEGSENFYKTFTLGTEILSAYAQNWDTKAVKLTINDMTGIENLNCAVQVSANGVTVEA